MSEPEVQEQTKQWQVDLERNPDLGVLSAAYEPAPEPKPVWSWYSYLRRSWTWLTAVACGVGLSLFSLFWQYAEEPEFCLSCHTMHTYGEGWEATAHALGDDGYCESGGRLRREDDVPGLGRMGMMGPVYRARCSDCHVPHSQESLFSRYGFTQTFYKAKVGLRHFYRNFTASEAEMRALRLSEADKEIVRGNCRDCHSDRTSRFNEGMAAGVNWRFYYFTKAGGEVKAEYRGRADSDVRQAPGLARSLTERGRLWPCPPMPPTDQEEDCLRCHSFSHRDSQSEPVKPTGDWLPLE